MCITAYYENALERIEKEISLALDHQEYRAVQLLASVAEYLALEAEEQQAHEEWVKTKQSFKEEINVEPADNTKQPGWARYDSKRGAWVADEDDEIFCYSVLGCEPEDETECVPAPMLTVADTFVRELYQFIERHERHTGTPATSTKLVTYCERLAKEEGIHDWKYDYRKAIDYLLSNGWVEKPSRNTYLVGNRTDFHELHY